MADLRTAFSQMSPAERDMAIRLLMSEAGNQGPLGMQAVAAVIGNRAAQSGMSPTQVMTARSQFEPMNTAAGRARMAGYSPESRGYQTAAQALDAAARGQDPTGGATHFYSPKAQAALGRNTPSWARGPGQDIGDHRFYALGYAPAHATNRHGIPPRPPADIPTQVAQQPPVRLANVTPQSGVFPVNEFSSQAGRFPRNGEYPGFPERTPVDIPPPPPSAPNPLAGSRYDDGGAGTLPAPSVDLTGSRHDTGGEPYFSPNMPAIAPANPPMSPGVQSVPTSGQSGFLPLAAQNAKAPLSGNVHDIPSAMFDPNPTRLEPTPTMAAGGSPVGRPSAPSAVRETPMSAPPQLSREQLMEKAFSQPGPSPFNDALNFSIQEGNARGGWIPGFDRPKPENVSLGQMLGGNSNFIDLFGGFNGFDFGGGY